MVQSLLGCRMFLVGAGVYTEGKGMSSFTPYWEMQAKFQNDLKREHSNANMGKLEYPKLNMSSLCNLLNAGT